jgi:glycosyltransferase involved in cell wall biosynthesis
MRLSIIVPTLGRPTLQRTLESIAPQVIDGDEVIVVSDGPIPGVQESVTSMGACFRYLEGPLTRQWGHEQRNAGMRSASGDYLAFIDDDDWYVKGALSVIRETIGLEREKLFLFRIEYIGRRIWSTCEVVAENICTTITIVPNRPDLPRWRVGTFNGGRGGDFVFCREVLEIIPSNRPVWVDRFIAAGDQAGNGVVAAVHRM